MIKKSIFLIFLIIFVGKLCAQAETITLTGVTYKFFSPASKESATFISLKVFYSRTETDYGFRDLFMFFPNSTSSVAVAVNYDSDSGVYWATMKTYINEKLLNAIALDVVEYETQKKRILFMTDIGENEYRFIF